MERGAQQAIVHGVAKSRTQLSNTHTHTHTHTLVNHLSSPSQSINKHFLSTFHVFIHSSIHLTEIFLNACNTLQVLVILQWFSHLRLVYN